jgi:outer membrane lipopolysaccharide assembly protein LptE/RlpB
MRERVSGVLWVAALAVIAAGCGYHVSGHADMMPKNIRTIAIPAFGNNTARPRLSQVLPEALTREFLSRTRYQVVADPNEADAVLTGSVIRYDAYPVLFDQTTGRASAAQINVRVSVMLRDRATGAILYSRDGVEFHERYEISVDPKRYTEEGGAALDRLSRDVARTVVSAVLENF